MPPINPNLNNSNQNLQYYSKIDRSISGADTDQLAQKSIDQSRSESAGLNVSLSTRMKPAEIQAIAIAKQQTSILQDTHVRTSANESKTAFAEYGASTPSSNLPADPYLQKHAGFKHSREESTEVLEKMDTDERTNQHTTTQPRYKRRRIGITQSLLESDWKSFEDRAQPSQLKSERGIDEMTDSLKNSNINKD